VGRLVNIGISETGVLSEVFLGGINEIYDFLKKPHIRVEHTKIYDFLKKTISSILKIVIYCIPPTSGTVKELVSCG
jgi:hypothetical protein